MTAPTVEELTRPFVADDGSLDPYLEFHARRLAMLVPVLEDLVTGLGSTTAPRVLDIGPGHLSITLQRRLGDRIRLDVMGFPGDPFMDHAGLPGSFVPLDLNDAGDPAAHPEVEPYDLVVMAEVIEHLHTAPSVVLGCLADLIRPGGLLVVQTPNAVALGKRLEVLHGRNPYELIREDVTNPGHFREYTVAELHAYLEPRFACERTILADYWSTEGTYLDRRVGGRPVRIPTSKSAVLAAVRRRRPDLRDGITVIARRR